MDRKRFLELLNKYLQGRATPEEKAMIDEWYERMGRGVVDELEGEDERAVEQRYWSIIERRLYGRAGEYRMVVWRSFRIAATIIFAVAASFSIWSETVEPEGLSASPSAATASSSVVWERVTNTDADVRRVELPDGSTVMLEPQSEVRFLSAFNGNERSVWLEGEGFFDVCPDASKPFFVHARELTTKVLGTSFSVRAFRYDKQVTVAVRTGKVFVTAPKADGHGKKEEVILTPNQKVVYDKVQQKMARAIVEQPLMILPYEEVRKMRFEEAPVSTIFKAIEKVYGVDLVYDSATYQACKLTSVISDGALFDRLDIICKAIGATYLFDENRIVIEGSACNSQ